MSEILLDQLMIDLIDSRWIMERGAHVIEKILGFKSLDMADCTLITVKNNGRGGALNGREYILPEEWDGAKVGVVEPERG